MSELFLKSHIPQKEVHVCIQMKTKQESTKSICIKFTNV